MQLLETRGRLPHNNKSGAIVASVPPRGASPISSGPMLRCATQLEGTSADLKALKAVCRRSRGSRLPPLLTLLCCMTIAPASATVYSTASAVSAAQAEFQGALRLVLTD